MIKGHFAREKKRKKEKKEDRKKKERRRWKQKPKLNALLNKEFCDFTKKL